MSNGAPREAENRSEQDSLAARIAQAEARLAELEVQRAAAAKVVADLREERVATEPVQPPRASLPVNESQQTPAEKVALFGSLFRGRTDVFPTHWRNSRKGTSGYSPACSNEWVRDLCEKPRIKCGDCPNQAFIPVTRRVILDHLQGRCVAGVYPLLNDESC